MSEKPTKNSTLKGVKLNQDSFSITKPSVETSLINAYFPIAKKHKLVIAWIEIHHDDLKADWELAVNGKKRAIRHLKNRRRNHRQRNDTMLSVTDFLAKVF